MTFEMNLTAPHMLNPQVLESMRNMPDSVGTEADATKSKKKVSEAGERVAPTWTAFYRETLGVDGVAHQAFNCADDYRRYEASETHTKILEMLTVLRSRDAIDCDPTEPQRMITIRIPKSLHDSLCKESNDLEISVNKLCITRLVQRVDLSMLPSSPQKRRGRRPGPDYHKSLTKHQNASSDINS
jgi:hypothetical protein